MSFFVSSLLSRLLFSIIRRLWRVYFRFWIVFFLLSSSNFIESTEKESHRSTRWQKSPYLQHCSLLSWNAFFPRCVNEVEEVEKLTTNLIVTVHWTWHRCFIGNENKNFGHTVMNSQKKNAFAFFVHHLWPFNKISFEPKWKIIENGKTNVPRYLSKWFCSEQLVKWKIHWWSGLPAVNLICINHRFVASTYMNTAVTNELLWPYDYMSNWHLVIGNCCLVLFKFNIQILRTPLFAIVFDAFCRHDHCH